MPIVAVTIVVAAILWGVIYAQRGSILVGCAVLVATGYVFGHEFWNFKLGPFPITLDRLVLGGLVVAVLVQWRIGRLRIRPLFASDWMLAAAIGIFALSAILSGQPELSDGLTSKCGRLLAAFLLPTALYAVARHIDVTKREWLALLGALTTLGVYLALTAVFEVSGKWSFVFPRYIADANLGIHFGRARGPELNAVSLGMYLTACTLCAWTLATHAAKRWQQLLLIAAIPLMLCGVVLSYTRSTWIGVAACALVIVATQIPKQWRAMAFGTASVAGLLVLIVSWSSLIGLKREGTAAEAEHSVDQRKSFAYVSWQMFMDHPVTGVGFGRFYDQKLPYLSDRSQQFELESIRSLHHHNTMLSVLTETGLVGLAAFAGLFVVWTRTAWPLARGAAVPNWMQAHGILMLALIVNYGCSALFHDLSLIPSQHLLLFFFAGLTANLQEVACCHARLGMVAGDRTERQSARHAIAAW
jgi:O-antigen ligase